MYREAFLLRTEFVCSTLVVDTVEHVYYAVVIPLSINYMVFRSKMTFYYGRTFRHREGIDVLSNVHSFHLALDGSVDCCGSDNVFNIVDNEDNCYLIACLCDFLVDFSSEIAAWSNCHCAAALYSELDVLLRHLECIHVFLCAVGFLAVITYTDDCDVVYRGDGDGYILSFLC